MDLSDILDGPELGEADQSHGSGAEGDHQIVTDAATIALDAAMAAARPPSRGPGLTNSPASAAQSPSGRRGDGGSRRGPGSATVGGSHPVDEDPAFYEHIVQRTNDLFVKLNITTRPIQAFEELQKSASSMFVAIFETLFNVRLKNVIRKPRVVTDYITNANLVMTALSESLPIDLSFLSGEDIYRGDPVQIHHMLSIFESLWAQLYGPASAELKASASESESLQSSFHAETDGKSGANAGPMSGVTASGGHLGPGNPGSFAQVRGEADVAGLKVLAERYPSIYRSVWAKQRAASAQRRQMSRKADASVATKRLENDLDRYRKAYEILVKTHEAEVRKASLRAKRAAKLATQAGKLDARVERARSARLGEELENKEQSRALRQQNKEEVLVRSLFSKALKVEKEYLLAMNEQEAEEQAILDKERLDRFASIENYYLDREEMLRERMTKENRDNNIADQARRIALKQLEDNLRDEYQAKLDRMSEKWEQHKEHDLLRSEEHLSQVFEDINDQLVRSVRLATATR
ncbi:Centrosomal protein of 95 kDa [Hondaea fermentalgiana]|uniref:Centrosomal protein of 95 kDa n=1 Tax=Hondaea fermentalgiana TaxID=2315210 RepID=A0A2R5GFQ7_9STRA|nr:Centrosomal protein of 95 kDa [Hondaea fermentalgiana]|eukprot:GBG29727.1 Centrosomal protein of 95 kDa [Hondaea fermentalgiana]